MEYTVLYLSVTVQWLILADVRFHMPSCTPIMEYTELYLSVTAQWLILANVRFQAAICHEVPPSWNILYCTSVLLHSG